MIRKMRGFTLTEVLIASIIIGMIAVLLFGVFTAAMRVWTRAGAQSQAFPPAFKVLNRINGELRNAAYIHPPAGNSIVFYAPKKVASSVTYGPARINDVPLEVDLTRGTKYYLSDATGLNSATGTFLWRRAFSQAYDGTTTTRSKERVAENVTRLSLSYEKVPTRILTIYSMAISVNGTEGGRTITSSFDSKIAFQNPMVVEVPALPVFPAGQ